MDEESLKELYEREATATRVIEIAPVEGWLNVTPIIHESEGDQ